MKLIYSKGACSLAPHIVLCELGIPHELVARDPKAPEFLKLNPLGAVPTLVMNDEHPLTETAAILRYLGDMKPEAKMVPASGTLARYRLDETLNFIATEIHKSLGLFFRLPKITSDEKVQLELRDYFMQGLQTRFDILAQRLKNSTYLFGDQFSVADAYLFTTLSWTGILKIDLANWPTLSAYLERVRARPGVQKAMKAEGLI